MNLTRYSINGITNDPMKNNKSALLLLSLLVIATTPANRSPVTVVAAGTQEAQASVIKSKMTFETNT